MSGKEQEPYKKDKDNERKPFDVFIGVVKLTHELISGRNILKLYSEKTELSGRITSSLKITEAELNQLLKHLENSYNTRTNSNDLEVLIKKEFDSLWVYFSEEETVNSAVDSILEIFIIETAIARYLVDSL